MASSGVLKLDMDQVRRNLAAAYEENPAQHMERLRAQQVAVYVMCGGGMIGRQHAERPLSAYIDARVAKRPYSRKAIDNATRVLAVMAEVAGINADSLPPMPDLHNSGIF